MNGCIFPNARQCSARSKRTGCQCRAPALSGKNVCRFHGGKAGAPAGRRNGRYLHGHYGKEEGLRRQRTRSLLKASRALLDELAARLKADAKQTGLSG